MMSLKEMNLMTDWQRNLAANRKSRKRQNNSRTHYYCMRLYSLGVIFV